MVHESPERASFALILLALASFGLVVLALVLVSERSFSHSGSAGASLGPGPSDKTRAPFEDPLFDPAEYATAAIARGPERDLVEYGKALAEETWRYIGPAVEDASLRYSGNQLACKNCHLKAGLQPFAAPWVGVTQRYPQFRQREGRTGTIEDRINGCMTRSMNGAPLPEDSREMQALVAWMGWLSHSAPADGKVKGAGFEAFAYPDRAANLERGKTLYQAKCSNCHGPEGRGTRGPSGGYVFPALAGDDSYNVGAGMNRVLTAASFIKNNMPLGSSHETPVLSDEEAFDLAAYIDSLSRPDKTDLERDFPDRKTKPMSTPYGPWEDRFSAEQHKYGPYATIRDYYRQKFDLDKSK